MDFTIILSIISIIGVILSLINSITNFISTKREMKNKINMTNNDIRFNKINLDNIEMFKDLSLNKICKDIVNYFEKISKQNKYAVYIFKINEDKKAKKVSSSDVVNDNRIRKINENTEFYEVINTGKPYYINNIQYFYKHGNKYFNSNPNWDQFYQSIISCPIKDNNENVLGFLTVEIMKPLNDLIDINNIIDYLKQECKLIASNKEFNTK
ncbi:MAG: hypothetical protein ACI4EJ_10455 [Bacteroides sp.]